VIASLPMYDQPSQRAANDALWAQIRAALGYGPEQLTRGGDLWAQWTAPDLALSQTCGLPFRAKLHDRVALVGTPDYGLAGCPPGYYNSVIAVRSGSGLTAPEELAGKRMAYNEALSQSGWAAPCGFLEAHGVTPGALVQSGAHQASAEMVAEGAADFAALDARAWQIFEEHTELGEKLTVIARTEPTPALPFITAQGGDTGAIRSAMQAALDALPERHRQRLGLRSVLHIPAEDYLALPIPAPPA